MSLADVLRARYACYGFVGTEFAIVERLILLIHTSTNLYTDFASV